MKGWTGFVKRSRRRSQIVLAFAWMSVAGNGAVALGQRALGLDVSAWQGSISQTTWNNLHNVDDRDFVFIRSSRGGTTGYYNQSDPNNNNGLNTLSQRYDDPYFVQNITRATKAGMFAGAYHFGRMDIVENTPRSGGIANNGSDEADHFIQMAGAWMRPGYLTPVFDFEAGSGIRTASELAQFAIDFSDRIHEVMGIRPAVYIGNNYSSPMNSIPLAPTLVAAYPTLWSARWPTSPNIQNGDPGDYTTTVYGPWDNPPNPADPWAFWQYTSTGDLASYNGNLDLDVAHGGLEFLKDHLVPAIWMNDANGDWSTLTNWNSGQTPVAPVQGPGQVARVGPLTLPATRLPGANDTVILDRPDASIAVTLSSGAHNIRKLYVHEALNITGGSLTVNYVPVADSTPIAAQFSAPVMLGEGASVSVHTLLVDVGQTFTLDGGSLTFNTIQLVPNSSTPAKILVEGDVQFNPLAGAAAAITHGPGSGITGKIDLGGGNRAFDVADGAANVDLTINVPVTNGSLTKSGLGTLALNGANSYSGDTTVAAGTLSLGGRYLADASDVYLSNGAFLNLNFAGTSDDVNSLFIDGISQPVGTWGAVGSGAQFSSPLITGPGMLKVATFIPPPLWGDYNEDGVVNAADYVVWRDSLGSQTALANDDTAGVGLDDYNRWQAHFGETNVGGAGSASGAAVPEAQSAMLAAIALALMGFAQCSRRLRAMQRG